MQVKQCKKCNQEKSLQDFHKKSASKDGHTSYCKSCASLVNKEWHRNNHRDRTEYIRVYDKKRDPAYCRYKTAKRRALKKEATPSWANMQYIKDVYADVQNAQELFKSVGVDWKFHVDHIIPLSHNRVCGLHCEHNLQVLTAEDNIRKSNNFKVY